MTAKEKANELLDYYWLMDKVTPSLSKEQAKQCTLILVDEILNSSPLDPNFADWDDCGGEHRYFYDAQKTHAFHFWQDVKKEIEKL